LTGAMRASRARKEGRLDTLPRTEHDMPIGTVGLIMLACLVRSDTCCGNSRTAPDSAITLPCSPSAAWSS
jgi:hypothetical protein